MANLGEEIRNKAQKVLMWQKMVQAFGAQGHHDKAEEMLSNIKSAAEDIMGMVYPLSASDSMTKAMFLTPSRDALIVYVNSTSFVMRTLDEYNRKEAIEYGLHMLERGMSLMAQIEEMDARALPSAVSCHLKIGMLCHILLATMVKDVVEVNEHLICNRNWEKLEQAFKQCYEELKIADPVSEGLKIYASLYKAAFENLPQCEPLSTHDIAYAASLLQKLVREYPIYSDAKEADDCFRKYDDLYHAFWWNRISKDTLKNYGRLGFIFDKYKVYLTPEVVKNNPRICNFYVADEDFNWYDFPEVLFENYEEVCRQHGVRPMKFYTVPLMDRVPYISPVDLERIHRDVVKTYLHLRDLNIDNIGVLPEYVDETILCSFIDENVNDLQMQIYLINFMTFMIELEATLIDMNLCDVAVHQYYLGVMDPGGSKDKLKRVMDDVLGAYTSGLKEAGILPSDWEFNPSV